MNKKTLLNGLFLLLCMIAGGVNSAWAEEVVYSTCLFGSTYNSKGVSNYTTSWSTTNGDFTWNIVNANNNNSGWTYIRFGSKNNASIGSIATADPYEVAITKVVVTIDNLAETNKTNVNSIKLYTSDNNDYSNPIIYDIDKASGTQTVNLSSPAVNLYYKVVFDCKQSSNGIIQVSKVEYYYNTGDDSKESVTLSFPASAYTADIHDGADSFKAPELTKSEDVDVTYTSSDEKVAKVDATSGKVTLAGVGTTTIKAALEEDENYNSASASYTLTVIDSYAKGAENNPYTVAEAIENTPSSGSSENVYVKGIVSGFYNNYTAITSDTYHRYYISDDGTQENQLLVYNGKGLDNKDFTDADDLLIGDQVTIVGPLAMYYGAAEINAGNYIVSLERSAIEQEDPTIEVENAEIQYGKTFTIDKEKIVGGTITVTSSNEAVATVDGLVITAKAVGTTTITVATAESAKYKAGSAEFTLTVTEDDSKQELAQIIFSETFDGCSGTGGNDGKFSDNVGTNNIIFDNEDAWTPAPPKCGGANKCIKFGTTNDEGSLSATFPLTGEAVLTFRVAGWGSGTNKLAVTATGAELSGDTNIILVNSVWTDYVVNIMGAEGEVTLTFTGKRGFIDDIIVKVPGGNTIDVKLSSTGYASYCSPYALDLTPTGDWAAWAVTGVNNTEVTFTKIEGVVPAKTPFIIYTANKEMYDESISLTVAEEEGTPVANNMLKGTLSPTYVKTEEDGCINFGLSGGSFVKIKDGVVPANKAYLPIETGIAAGARLNIVFEDETTGIVDRKQETANDGCYYSLNGQRVNPTKGGLYIVNGKKMVIK